MLLRFRVTSCALLKGDQVRPYVDHDYPLDGAGLVRQRAEVLLKPDFERTLDHVGLINAARSPMALEIARRRHDRKKQKDALKSKR